jgi:hypothetical protein
MAAGDAMAPSSAMTPDAMSAGDAMAPSSTMAPDAMAGDAMAPCPPATTH